MRPATVAVSEGDDEPYTPTDSSVIAGGDSGVAQDGGPSPVDANVAEASAPRDAAISTEASVSPMDASTPPDAAQAADAALDASSNDAGASDGAVADAGPREGGARDAGGSDAGGTTFTRVFAIFQASCGTCHGSMARGSLNMSSKSMAFTELVNPGNAEGTSCMGMNRKRVVPGMPDASLLIKKLEGTQDCGDRMPEGRAALSAAQIAEVHSWIAAGAPNN